MQEYGLRMDETNCAPIFPKKNQNPQKKLWQKNACYNPVLAFDQSAKKNPLGNIYRPSIKKHPLRKVLKRFFDVCR